jgi:type VI secretion system secreted protein VgrG
MIDVFTMSSSVLPEGTRVVGFRGSEGISRPYVFEIYLTIDSGESHEFDLADAVGAKATLTLSREDGSPPFAFNGLFSELSLIHEMSGRALCRALLVPQLWRLRQTFHSRIFTAMSIPDIIAATLEDGGLAADDFTFKLSSQYKPEEHVCQYQESHFDFISRWMEREGLYYYFEQGDDREKLIITDSASFHEDLVEAKVRFYALAGGDVTARACLQTFICRHRALPGSVRFKDYDYAKPTLGITGTAPVSKVGLGEINIHGARFFSPEGGKRLATLHAEEILAREVVFTGSGTTFHLRPGYTFSLEDHPRASFDAKYLVTEVEHHGNQAATTPELRRMTGLDSEEVYRADVTAIPESVQFRAERKTPWPRVYGTEHGLIDGDADSEYAQIDDQGRYLVRFAFDESDLNDGKASTRVRMMQPHGGGIEGWHFPLRKGTEVLFTFLGGDPDRPVIAGVVPNAHKPSPVTKSNHTTNVIQTGGRNRFELEDKAGSERITLQTPFSNAMIRMGAPNEEHTMIVRTDGATLLDAGQDWDVRVGGKLDEQVQGTVDEAYFTNQITQINSGRSETIYGGGMDHKITGGWRQTVKGGSFQNITGSYTHTVSDHVAAHYGTMELIVDGYVNHWCGSAILNYADIVTNTQGATSFNASKINLFAPDIHASATKIHFESSTWKGISAPSIEGFTSKNSIGIQKFDGSALNIAANGVKMEVTKVAMARTGIKIDFATTKVDNSSMKLQSGTLAAENRAVRLFSAGLTKIG